MADEVAVARLEADTEAFDEAFAGAESGVSRFASAVEGKVATLSSKVESFVGGIGDTFATLKERADEPALDIESAFARTQSRIESFASRVLSVSQGATDRIQRLGGFLTDTVATLRSEGEEQGFGAGEQLGSVLGRGLGATLGTLVLPGVGTAIGQAVGAEYGPALARMLADFIPLDGLLDSLGAFGPLISAQAQEGNFALLQLRSTWSSLTGELTTLASEFNLSEVFTLSAQGDMGGVTERIDRLLTDVTDLGREKFFLMFQRVEGYIDSVVGRFKEPLAGLADNVQKVGVALGLVDADTKAWGDTLRSVEGVGRSLVEAVLTGFGYVQDTLRIVAGAFKLVYVSAFAEGLAELTRYFGDFVRFLEPILDQLGVGGQWTQDLIAGSKAQAEEFARYAARMRKEGDDLVMRGLEFAQAARNVEAYNDPEGRARRARQIFLDDMKYYMDRFKAGLPPLVEGEVEAAVAPERPTAVGKNAVAATQGSAQAIRAIIADATQRNPDTPTERTLRAAERNAKAAERAARELEKLNAKVKEPDPDAEPESI